MIYYVILYQYCTFNHNFLIKICLLFLFCVSAKLHPCMHKWTLLLIGNNEMQSCLNTKMYTLQPTNLKKNTKKPIEIRGNSKNLTLQFHTVFFIETHTVYSEFTSTNPFWDKGFKQTSLSVSAMKKMIFTGQRRGSQYDEKIHGRI